ncbi:MAG TPA: alpha-amylase family glycosyl hydrolase [Rhodothermales bacterium]|nr:alpha-amylase family glycosyl hydrolase [Rhodothermales bacterium]
MLKRWLGLCILLLAPWALTAQTINVTFRYIPEPNAAPPVRVFVPGQFNNWGPNASGVIAAGAVSQMDLDASGAFYKKTISLTAGQSYMYKMHLHLNTSGTSNSWISDPLNPKTNPADNNNSVLDVTNPIAFQPAREANTSGQIKAFSVGLFSSKTITKIDYELNGVAYTDGLAHFDATTGIFRYVPTAPLPSGTGFKVTLTDADGKTATAELKSEAKPVVTKAPRPGGMVEGVNYHSGAPTEATFVLYAPKKEYVYVIGDFNNWEARPEYLMKKDSTAVDRVYWWLKITGLTPGVEYAYQYYVDGKIKVADPFATKILDPFNDGFIPSSNYPNLKAYPNGKTEYDVSVLQTNKAAYNWTATGYQRPKQSELVIYELLVRDFTEKRSYQSVIDTLGYLQKLGVNAIQLMPVQEFDGNSSWGYNPKFYFAPDKYYGTAEALKKLIDECHKRNMAVIIDVVYNHQTGSSPFARLYNASQKGDPAAAITADNYWLNTTAKHPYNVFNDANHEAWQMQELMDRANAYWLNEFNVDGFRFDLSKGFTQTVSTEATMGNYDASRVRILKRMADAIWRTDPTAYVILEHFAENREEKELADYGTTADKPGMMLWGNANGNFNEATMGYHDGGKSNFEWAYFGQRGWNKANLISYMESHDEERLMVKNLLYGNALGDYKIKDLWVAIERMKAAGAMFFTVPGPKMIWQFGELGYDFAIDYNGRTGEKPVRWTYAKDETRYRLYKTWAAIINMRRANPVFHDPETVVSQSLNLPVKRINLTHPTMKATIVANFSVTTMSVNPNFQQTGTWYDFFSGNALNVTNTQEGISLLPGEFRIYTTQPLPTPEPGLIRVATEMDTAHIPDAFTLQPNYPNPFNPSTTLSFSLPRTSDVVFEVFDAVGRKVAVVAKGLYAAGTHRVIFDALGLPSGLYVARLQAGNVVKTQKLTLVK